MTKKIFISVLIIIIALSAIIVTIHLRSSRRFPMKKLTNEFLMCLPDELSKGQKDEVRSILDHFQRSIEESIVAAADADSVVTHLEHYIVEGAISKRELQVFLAKVSRYMTKLDDENPDSAGGMNPPDKPVQEKMQRRADTTTSVPRQ
jgi:hypothetical protein